MWVVYKGYMLFCGWLRVNCILWEGAGARYGFFVLNSGRLQAASYRIFVHLRLYKTVHPELIEEQPAQHYSKAPLL